MDTLDAEQDPRRRHKSDTVFFICGFNTMGEFNVGSGFFFCFFWDAARRSTARWENDSDIVSVCDVLTGLFNY